MAAGKGRNTERGKEREGEKEGGEEKKEREREREERVEKLHVYLTSLLICIFLLSTGTLARPVKKSSSRLCQC